MYNMSDLGTFYARKLKFCMRLAPRTTPSSLCYSCLWVMPGVGLGIKMYNKSDFTLRFRSAFLLEVIIWIPFMLGS